MTETIRKTVFIRTMFIAFHKWDEAPPHVQYLRSLHRHVFHVELHKIVTENNREIEFITLRADVDRFLRERYDQGCSSHSCEEFAQRLFEYFNASKVIVSEDGENGACIEITGSIQ